MRGAALVIDSGRDIGRLGAFWGCVPDGWVLWIVATGEAVRGEAGAAVREVTAQIPRVRVVSMFEEGRSWEEAVASAVRGCVAVLERLGVRVVITYGPTAGSLAAAFAAKILAVPHIHILRGDENHPFRATEIVHKIATKTLSGPRFSTTPLKQEPQTFLFCLIDPYNTTKRKRLYLKTYEILKEANHKILFVCPDYDKLAMRPIREMGNIIHKRFVSYKEMVGFLEKASLFVTNTEVAFLEARVCGVPVVLVDEWGARRIGAGGRRYGVSLRWTEMEGVWKAACSLKMGVERRGLRRG